MDKTIRDWLTGVAEGMLEEAAEWEQSLPGSSESVAKWIRKRAGYLRQVAGYIKGNLRKSKLARSLADRLYRLTLDHANHN